MKTYLLIACLSGALVTACATQGDLDRSTRRLSTLEGRLARLETESRESRARQDGYQSSRQAEDQQYREQSAQVYASIEQLREENRALSGRIEEVGHALRVGSETGQVAGKDASERLAALESRVQTVDDRIRRMEQYLNLEAPKAQTPAAPAQPPPAGGGGLSESAAYAEAKKAFDQGDTAGARRGFEAFLAAFPGSKIADSAQFWIGECYYRENWYEKAILEYQKVIEKYPSGNKVRASLLKQGLSFFNLGDKANARLIFKELIAKYPGSEEAALADKKLKGF